jgi:protoporphyrinogen IX oxidase
VLGLALVWLGDFHKAHWMQAKFVLVILMSAAHGFFVSRVRDFAADRNAYSQKFYRIANEIPTALMILIVILVVLKPF